MRSTRSLLIAGVIAAAPPAASAATIVFSDESAFLSATGASVGAAIPDSGNVGSSEVLGNLTFTNPNGNRQDFGASSVAWSDWSTLIPGNALAISGNEDLDLAFATPVHSIGFQVHEPTDPGAPPDATNTGPGTFIDSVFEVTLKSGGSTVGTASFAPANDTLAYFGIWSTASFDSFEMRETSGGIENEYFGAFATGTTPVPLPAGGALLIAGLGALGGVAARRRGRR